MKSKTIKIALIVLAVVLFAGAVVHTFTRKVTPPNLRGNPSGRSYLYLYPKEELVIYYGDSGGGFKVFLCETGHRSPEGVAYQNKEKYYNLSPDGTLVNCFWGEEYGRLEWNWAYEVYSTRIDKLTTYWEPSYHVGHTWDLDTGWCVPREETEAFLREVLPKTGLNGTETNDVIADWLLTLQESDFNLFTFWIDYTPLPVFRSNSDSQKIGNTLRVFFLTQPLDEPVELEPQTFEPFDREGFTVVQWGGVMLS